MVAFDRSMFEINPKDTKKAEKIIDTLIKIYSDCGSCLICDKDPDYAMRHIDEQGIIVCDNNKQKIMKTISVFAKTHDNVKLYYVGSAYERTIRELPQINTFFFDKFMTDNKNIKIISNKISEIISSRLTNSKDDRLFSCKFDENLDENDMFCALKEVNFAHNIVKLLYLKGLNSMFFVINKHLFSISKNNAKDGFYWQFDIDDGFYSLFGQVVPNELKVCFENWKNDSNKGSIFTQNIL